MSTACERRFIKRRNNPKAITQQTLLSSSNQDSSKLLQPVFNVTFTDYCGLSLRKKLHANLNQNPLSITQSISRKISYNNQLRYQKAKQEWLKVLPLKLRLCELGQLHNRLKAQTTNRNGKLNGLKVREDWLNSRMAQLQFLSRDSCRIEVGGRRLKILSTDESKQKKNEYRPFTAEIGQDKKIRLTKRLKTMDDRNLRESGMVLCESSFTLHGWDQGEQEGK